MNITHLLSLTTANNMQLSKSIRKGGMERLEWEVWHLLSVVEQNI